VISVPARSDDPSDQIYRLERRLARERETRLMAERIAEQRTRDLFIQKQRLKLVESIASAANLLDDPSDAFRVALDEICNYTGWTTGHVWIFAEDQSEIVELISSGVWASNTSVETKAFRRVTQSMTFGPGLSLPGRVLEKRQAVWSADIGLDIHFQRARIAQECGLRAAFAFPALIGTEVGAVLEFFQSRTSAPDEALLEMLDQIAAVLGRVVERHRTALRLKRNNELAAQRDAAEQASKAKSAFLMPWRCSASRACPP
jgi:GAF domain-containing protein